MSLIISKKCKVRVIIEILIVIVIAIVTFMTMGSIGYDGIVVYPLLLALFAVSFPFAFRSRGVLYILILSLGLLVFAGIERGDWGALYFLDLWELVILCLLPTLVSASISKWRTRHSTTIKAP